MRISQERNVVVIAITTTCALATALWLAGVTSHAALPRLKGKSAGAGEAPILSTLTARSPILEGVVLNANQVEIKTWTVQGRTYAYLKLLLPNSGYRVVDWGQVVRVGNDSSADALVDHTNGPSVKAVTTTAQIYDLGPLANGNYTFTFKNSGQAVKSLAFTISSAIPPPNPIDNAREFVKQQYRDFLNREADQAGEDFWTDNITKCSDSTRRPAGQTETQCTLRQKETTSGAFFQSPEFQYTGYFVYRMYQGALGRQPKLSEFTPDAQFVGAGIVVNGQLSGALINRNKADFAQQFVNCTDPAKYRCSEFKAIYDGLNNQQYVDKLFQTTGVNASASDRTALVNGLNANPVTETRASVLQKVVDGIVVISEGNQQFTTSYGQAFYNSEFTRAFVQLEYFGYMKRDPDQAGYAFWLGKLNQFGGDFVRAEMVLAFISSPEYRERFMVAAKGSIVVIDKPSVFFPASGQSTQLSAQILDPQGAPSAGSVSWTSTAPDKVSVDAAGKVMAKAIGSAQIIAEAPGIRSAPTLVIVAQPQPGALLVTDAQVVSVGPPLGLAAGESPGVGTQYEVTLQGVSAPAPGTLMVAAETAPIAGKVVATRQTAGGLVVTLAIAPLYQLFSAYDIDLTIELSAFPLEEVRDGSALTTQNAMWHADRSGKSAHSVVRALDALEAFKAFKCKGELEPKLGEPPIQVSLENNLKLVLEDQPGHSKQALEGSMALVGSAGLKLEAGFEASGVCDAQAQPKFPVFGWLSAIVMPAVRLGLGVELKTEILLVQAELGVKGKVGFSGALGWECGGASPDCRGLEDVTPIRDLETKSKIPSENDKQAKISAQFYVIAGLDAVIFVGLTNAEILEARIGPKQSFDLAFEDDQAARTDYASSYDLKLEGVIEPGSALKKAIEKVIGDDSTTVKFEAKFAEPLSESPKGSLSVSKAKVRPGEAVDFTVSLDQKTVAYFLLGYNVEGVELWRKRDDQTDFKHWKFMDLNATNQATYKWVPEAADAGKYEFAAFVSTKLLDFPPVPLLEVSPNSIQKVEVSCFSSSPAAKFGSKASLFAMGAGIGTQSPTCADTWVGTASSGDAAYGPNQTESILTLKVDTRVDTGDPAIVAYYAEGTVKVKNIGLEQIGCTVTPTQFTFDRDTGTNTPGHEGESNQFYVDYGRVPATFGGAGFVRVTRTITCPGGPPRTEPFLYSFFRGDREVALSADGLTIQDSFPPFYSFQLTRP